MWGAVLLLGIIVFAVVMTLLTASADPNVFPR